METFLEKAEFRSFGEGAPVYQVLEIKKDSVTIEVVTSGEIIKNYPLSDFLNDPSA
jgi:hypothetical protein